MPKYRVTVCSTLFEFKTTEVIADEQLQAELAVLDAEYSGEWIEGDTEIQDMDIINCDIIEEKHQ